MTTQPQDEALFDLDSVFEVDDYLYFYSESLTDERTDAEVAGLVKLLNLEPPQQILDLACGFGRHSNRLAGLGYQMTGVDYSAGFLEMARQGAAQRGVQVTYFQGDNRTIRFESSFDYVLLLFTSFGYFDDPGNQQVLETAAAALKPGGYFVFDVPNRDTYLKNIFPYFVLDKEGNLMIDRNSFDTATGFWHNKRIVIRNGIRKDKPFSIRLYNPSEISERLNRAGLEVSQMYSDWEGKPLGGEARRMIIVAQKNKP